MKNNLLREIEVSYKRTEIEKEAIKGSYSAYLLFKDFWDATIDYKESVNVLYLNRRYNPIGIHRHSIGGLDSAIIDVREIFSIALKVKAQALILAHNHPSGSLIPSSQDIQITKQCKQAADFLNLSFLDHLIITSESYYSLSENGHF
jgi:DNA repair protein RadC